ncbi:hypothetical protein OG709_35655 (plasmid) [Streptomyces sp. NBC_01267]|uniref:hypothetical protein n=1 Tax=Streptomyces sp. NBC_01267 TaxID=2903805 RepID=UPI002E36184B|nr:hypothetical protein [Streptomyces sp. NBC_01267]
MLHTAVTNAGNDLRDALGKSVEKLETSGQAAQQDTTRAVVDELGRMRANLRETRDRLSAGGEMLNAEVRQAVTELRTEMRDVRTAVEGIAPAPVTPETHTPSYQPVARNAAGPEASGFFGTSPEPSPVATASEHSEPPAAPSLSVTIPAQRDSSDTEPPGALPAVELIKQAVRDVLAEELAPLSALLTEQAARPGDGLTVVRDDVRAYLGETVRELREQLDAARQEARAELAALREESASLRDGLEQLRPQPDDGEPAAAEVNAEHSELLKQAARVSSIDLLCHRDVWEFITVQAGRHPHFRVPPQVTDEGHERIRAALSGRSLIAMLISLHAVGHTAKKGDGDRELAATLYERIQASLARLTPQGQPVTITLDDRSVASDDVPPSDDTTPGDTPEPITSLPATATDGSHEDELQQGPSGKGADAGRTP